MRILFFGTYDAESHPRVGVLRDGLASAVSHPAGSHPAGSHPVRTDLPMTVDECNVPLGLTTAARVSMLRQPWRLPRLALRLAVCWFSLVRRAWRRPRPDVVVVGYLGHFDVLLARRLFPDRTIVLDHLVGASDTAADRGVSGGVRQRLLRALDGRALAAADVVVVDTEEHRALLPPDQRPKAVVVPVGAPPSWFTAYDQAAPPASPGDTALSPQQADPAGLRPLSVVFFGLYTPLQGTPTIGAALAAIADAPVDITMIGSGQDFATTRHLASGNPRVSWLDWVGTAELPDIVAGHDVCLGIFGTGPKALRVVPNKVFQGAAAGLAIVTSDTPAQRRALGDAALFVPAGDSVALAAALRDLAADRVRLATARSAAHRLAVEQFRPALVVAALSSHLNALHAPDN